MLLNDIGKSSDSTLKKINVYLETNYGFKISEDVAYKDIVSITEKIEEEITELKIKGDNAKHSSEISKRLLILEGLKTLREFALVKFESPDLEHVVNSLSDFVHDSFRLGGTSHQDFDECVRDGMKHYRSSKYRFPDDMIEQRVRQAAMSKIHGLDEGTIGSDLGGMVGGTAGELAGGALGTLVGGPVGGEIGAVVGNVAGTNLGSEVGDSVTDECDMGMMEKWSGNVKVKHTGQNTNKSVEELRHEAAAAKKRGDTKAVHQKDFAIRAKTGWGKTTEEMDEGKNPWEHEGKHSGSGGGYNPTPNDLVKNKLDRISNPNLKLEPKKDLDKPVDPFAARKAELQKGTKPVIEAGSDDWTLADVEPAKNTKDEPGMVRNPKTGKMEPDPFYKRPKDLEKGVMMKENLVKNLRRLLETEVSQAEVMMAAKGFANELQEMIEKIGRLQNEDLPPVTDQMRETYGTESSSAFQTQIYGALQGVMDALYTAKGQVDDAVSNMAQNGQFNAQTDMDKDVGMDDEMGGDDEMDADLDLDNIGDELGADGEMDADEFGGAEEEEPLGRSMKTEALQQKVANMRKLIEKAKKLKEAKKNA